MKKLWALGALLSATAALAVAAPGWALTPSAPAPVTSGSPFPVLCAGAGHDPTGNLYEDAEVEPWVSVDQLNTAHVGGNWQQDRWSDGGSHGLVATASSDGGATFGAETFADFSRCPLFAHFGTAGYSHTPGGLYDRASDPWVDFGAAGRLHQIAITLSKPQTGFAANGAVEVSHSDDLGSTWSNPTVLKADSGGTVLNDKESITADTAGNVYAIWDRLVSPSEHAPVIAEENSIGFRGPVWFASSTDNGDSWSTARKIFDPGQENQTIGNQIAVTPSGTLIDVFTLITNFSNAHKNRGFFVAVLRSTDQGATWSGPIRVSRFVDRTVRTPGDLHRVRTGDIIPDIAVDPTSGQVYLAWQDGSSGTPTILTSTSTDDGETWSAPVQANDSPAGVAAFTASIDVNAAGTPAVTYYDFRNDTATTATALTDYWITTSSDNGASWNASTRVTPSSFDMAKAPQTGVPTPNAYFVGDYEGLDHAGNDFKLFFVQTTGSNLTDVFASTVTP
jgi:hypothetical protein